MDSKLDWEEYQEAVEEVFIRLEEEVLELEQESGGRIFEEVWSRWTDFYLVITAPKYPVKYIKYKLQVNSRFLALSALIAFKPTFQPTYILWSSSGKIKKAIFLH